MLTSSGDEPAPTGGGRAAGTRPLPAELALGPYGQVGSLVLATARALGAEDRDRPPGGSVLRRIAAGLAAPREERAALRPDQAGLVDADAIAEFTTGQYPPRRYPAVVIGSPHGAAAHLAVALRVPWLPAAFDVSVRSDGPAPSGTGARADNPPGSDGTVGSDGTTGSDGGRGSYGERGSDSTWRFGGAGAGGAGAGGAGAGGAADGGVPALLAVGVAAAEALLASNPQLSVRQVHDPAISTPGAITLFLRWRALPAAYQQFMADQLVPGAPILLVRDTSTAPALVGPGRFGFQYGGPDDDLPSLPGTWVHGETAYGVNGGFAESLRAFAADRDHPLHRIMFGRPEALSAAVADVYRRWLRSAGKTGNRLVIECGRLLDPAQVIRAGLVPFWLPAPLHHAVSETAWWLAGSEPFSQIEVLIEPPGTSAPSLASLAQFEAVARFATRQGRVDVATARAYPYGTVSARHASRVLKTHPYDLPAPPELPTSTAVSWLSDSAETADLMIC
jgi:hypothetical protein